ncbi:MAG: hypothetical protein RIE53_06415 [Rhodothermales bacterium]
MNRYPKIQKAGIPGSITLVLAMLLAACDSSSVVDHADVISPVSPDNHIETVDIPVETIPTVTSPKTLVRALDDRVLVKARARAAAATPDQIRALVLAREAAEEVIALNGNVTPDVLDNMVQQANMALEPFFNAEDAVYLSAVARRLDELGLSPADVPALTKSLQVEGSLSKTGPCDRACTTAYINNVTQIELAYLGGLLGCTATGPGVLLCFGGVTAAKTVAMVTSTLDYTACIDACRENN